MLQLELLRHLLFITNLLFELLDLMVEISDLCLSPLILFVSSIDYSLELFIFLLQIHLLNWRKVLLHSC